MDNVTTQARMLLVESHTWYPMDGCLRAKKLVFLMNMQTIDGLMMWSFQLTTL